MQINIRGTGATPEFDWTNISPALQVALDVLKDEVGERLADDGYDIEPMEVLAQAVPDMTEETQEELEGFREVLVRALKIGVYDADRLVEQLPDEVKGFAEENEIDLIEVFRGLQKLTALLKTELSGASYDAEGLSTDDFSEEDLLDMIGAMLREEEHGIDTEA